MADKQGPDQKRTEKAGSSGKRTANQGPAVKSGKRTAGPIGTEVDRLDLQLRQITDNMVDMIGVFDNRTLFQYASPSFERNLGYRPEDLIGTFAPEKIHPDERDAAIGAIDAMLKSGKGSVQFRYRHKDGSYRWIESTGRNVIGDTGTVIGAIMDSRDITDRKQAEETLQAREKQLTESQRIAHIGSWEHNLMTGKVLWSDELFRLLGLDPKKDPADFTMFFNMIHPDDQTVLRRAIEETVQFGKPFDIEYRFVYRDGAERIIHARAELLHDETGTQNILSGTAQDITERKKAEEELAISEGRYRNLFEDSPVSLWEEDITDLQEHIRTLRASGITDFRKHMADHPDEVFKCLGLVKIVSVNKATLDMYEAPDQTRLLQGLSQVFTDQSFDAFRGIIVALAEGAQIFTCEAVNQTLGGRTINVLLRWSLLASDHTKRSRALISIVDITERKLAESALRESEKRLRTLIDAIPDAVVFKDTAGCHIIANRANEEVLGLAPEMLIGKMVEDLLPPEEAATCRKNDEEVMKKAKTVRDEEHMTGKNGTTRIIDTIKVPLYDDDGKAMGLVGIIRDITERKRAEEALNESKARFQAVFEQSNDGITVADLNGNFVMINQAFCQMTGYKREELLSMRVYDLIPGHVQTKLFPLVAQRKREGHREVELRRKDGRTFIAAISGSILQIGESQFVQGIIQDITERKQAEEKIRESEQFIRGILDTVDEGFIVVDRDYRIMTANKTYCSQAGLACDEVIGRHCFEISHRTLGPCYEEEEKCAVRLVFETGEPHAALHKHTDREGRMLYVETKGFPIKDAAGNVTSVIETINNITERHLLEEERLKTQKLESIGTLAGGIAHDFNNLLQGIFGYISVAKMTIDRKDRALAMLQQAENALHQSVNLTAQLLTFSKGGKPVKKPIDIRPVIEDAARFTLSGSRSDFHMEIVKDLWNAEADEGQIGQVIQNIVLNADQAMPLGGSVMITAKNVAAGSASLPQVLARGNYIAISIQDTGVGIPEQYVGKIFDPYFTTKEKGSGLGLATSYSIVRNHSGMIGVRTMPGEGSTFTIYLPAIAGSAKTAPAVIPGASPQQAARVLVMDDEEIIRDLSRELIGALGHEVDIARHGEEALEKYLEALATGKPFDLVILDLTVRGGLGGVETIQKLREIDPAVKAVVSSGYSDDASIASHLSLGFRAYLKKPYDIDQLHQVLKSVLS